MDGQFERRKKQKRRGGREKGKRMMIWIMESKSADCFG